MTIKAIQQTVDNWIKKYGVNYFDALTNMALLSEEVGEVARIIARQSGQQSPKLRGKRKDKEKKLEDELCDVLFVLICLANQHHINLETAFEKNLIKKTKRDKNRHIKNKKIKRDEK